MEDLRFLYSPDWTRLQPGDKTSVVITDLVWEDGIGIGKVTPGEQPVRVMGLIPKEAFGFPTAAFLDATFLHRGSLVDLSVDSASCVLGHRQPQVSHITNFVELCRCWFFVHRVHSCGLSIEVCSGTSAEVSRAPSPIASVSPCRSSRHM